MSKRFRAEKVRAGLVTLDVAQSRHARDVLRLGPGTVVELFDAAGRVGTGPITALEPLAVVDVTDVREPPGDAAGRVRLTVASAIPKGARADWMVEKLSELGTDELVPLDAARSVVVPEGRNKRERWLRLADESAKQSRRAGVMRITEPMTVDRLLVAHATFTKWCLTTQGASKPVSDMLPDMPASLVVIVGPEGGWTDQERTAFDTDGCEAVRLTDSILRVETAAIAIASVVMTSTVPAR